MEKAKKITTDPIDPADSYVMSKTTRYGISSLAIALMNNP